MSGGLKSGLCSPHINSVKDLSREIHDQTLLKIRKRPPTNSHFFSHASLSAPKEMFTGLTEKAVPLFLELRIKIKLLHFIF